MRVWLHEAGGCDMRAVECDFRCEVVYLHEVDDCECHGMLRQDRHVVIKELMPDPNEPWAADASGIERGYAAVFDGHKRSECAEMAAARMHPYLAKCAPPAITTYGLLPVT